MQAKWFTTYKKRTGDGMRLFCFPYAGGNASTFAGWNEGLPSNVSVLGLQAPARTVRLMEPPIRDMAKLVDEIILHMKPLITGDYVVLGHSLGARVAFEVSLKLVEHGLPAPRIFIGSGSPAPSVKRTEAPIFDLPEVEFIEELRRMGGTPDSVLDNRELREIFMPAIRADFELVDKYKGNQHQLDTCAHVFYGKNDDSVSMSDVEQWQTHFSEKCSIHPVDGDHYFIDSKKKEVLKVMNQILCYRTH